MTFSDKKSVGSVSLVGAGPGDPGLITIRGLELLRRADVIIYDALANLALLKHARPEAEQIDAGKRAGRHRMGQDEINLLLLERARAGGRVVRLKGGDPYLFGRGAEEAIYLGRHGITCEVVPGVTAGIAAAGAAGIPLTHRDHSSAVVLVTGHEDPDKATSSIDYHVLVSLVQSGGTICFYMGAARIGPITQTLLDHGLCPKTPVAVIQSGTLPSQRTVRSTLRTAQADAVATQIGAPAIIVVGAVAGIEESGLNWFTRRPLFCKRIIITRSRSQVSQLRRRLEALGAEVLEAPTIEIIPVGDTAPVEAAVRHIREFDWLILTSVNGVIALADHLRALTWDGRHLHGVQVAAIGQATADACAQELGIRPDLVPSTFVAESLTEQLIGQYDVGGKRLLLLRADIARPELVYMLSQAGAVVTDVAIYATRPPVALPVLVTDALSDGRVDWISFTSSSTVKHMVQLLGSRRELLKKVRIASIGPITTRAVSELGLKVDVEANPSNIEGLVDAILAAQNFGNQDSIAGQNPVRGS